MKGPLGVHLIVGSNESEVRVSYFLLKPPSIFDGSAEKRKFKYVDHVGYGEASGH